MEWLNILSTIINSKKSSEVNLQITFLKTKEGLHYFYNTPKIHFYISSKKILISRW